MLVETLKNVMLIIIMLLIKYVMGVLCMNFDVLI